MEHTVLVDASEDLHRASKETDGDVRDRLDEQARDLAEHARTSPPDRERLLAQRETLETLRKERSLGDAARDRVEAASEKIASFLGGRS